MAGYLITFEGTEGCGKTTQLNQIQTWLCENEQLSKHIPVIATREPGGTKLGQHLRHLLLTQNGDLNLSDRAELLLYAADRAQHVDQVLRPHLAAGAIVLCDRYVDSTIAYQGYGRGLSLDLIQQVNELATGGLVSNLTLWLDVDVEVGLARARQRQTSDRIEQAALAFHQRVREGYASLASCNSERVSRIDANQPLKAVTAQICQVLKPQLQRYLQ